MKSTTAILFALVAFGAIVCCLADYGYHKPLEIKHVWTKHDYGHGYGGGKDAYGHGGGGHGYGHGKTLVGYSSRYHVMKHGGHYGGHGDHGYHGGHDNGYSGHGGGHGHGYSGHSSHGYGHY